MEDWDPKRGNKKENPIKRETGVNLKVKDTFILSVSNVLKVRRINVTLNVFRVQAN